MSQHPGSVLTQEPPSCGFTRPSLLLLCVYNPTVSTAPPAGPESHCRTPRNRRDRRHLGLLLLH
ncbi:hypothetical protein PAMP_021615 [Pampus punctatissimus]